MVKKPPCPAPCIQCGETRSQYRRRGLCRKCHGQSPLRNRSEYEYVSAPLADAPLTCEPGTAEKIQAMMERASRNLAIFHPHDEKLDLE